MDALPERSSRSEASPTLLSVEDLHVQFTTSRGVVRAVEGISYTVNRGEAVAIVGESGCGKSVSSLAIMRLLPRATAQITRGRIMLDGRNLLELSDDDMRAVRGREVSMIFQEPMTSLNPVLPIGLQIKEPLFIHLKMTEEQALRSGDRAARACRHHRCQAPPGPVSAPIFRRHAPARHDRDRARLQSEADHRRRADHRARRHHSGADPRIDEGPLAPARHCPSHHHAQSRHRRALRRPRERHVCGEDHRAG